MKNQPTYIDGDYSRSPAFNDQGRLVYGLAAVGGVWGPVQESESVAAVLYALENGISVFDTAPSYADSEYFLGRALKQWSGERPFISTKIGRLRGEDAFDTKLDYSNEGMKRSFYNSLETIGVDSIDLLFLHEPQLVPIENAHAILETLHGFKEQGLVKHLGVGGNPTREFMPFVTKENFDVISGFLHMSACNLSAFDGEIQHYQKEHIAYYAASPLHFSLLGNQLEKYRKEGVDGEWITERDLHYAIQAKAIADKHDMPLITLAQRYLFSIAEADRVVLGAKNVEQIKSSIADWKLGKLPEELFNEITKTIQTP